MTDYAYIEAMVPKLQRFDVGASPYRCSGCTWMSIGNHHVPMGAMTATAREHYARFVDYDPVPLCDLCALGALP